MTDFEHALTLHTDIEWNQNEEHTLTIDVDARPKPNFTWSLSSRFNAVAEKEILIIPKQSPIICLPPTIFTGKAYSRSESLIV